MTDLVRATAAALAAPGPFVAVTGHPRVWLRAVSAAAAREIVAPGPTTRLSIAAGVVAGAHRAVAVVDGSLPLAASAPDVLAITGTAAVAAEALQLGWQVIQPWSGADVAGLLAETSLPALLFLGEHEPGDDADLGAPHAVREWERGALATIAASGPAVGTAVRLGGRLRARGVDIGLLELAVLTRPEHAPLAGGAAIFVAGRGAGHAWRRGDWPTTRVDTVLLTGTDADLVGAVLSVVPVG